MKRFITLFSLSGSLFALPLGNPVDGELYRNGMIYTGPACYENGDMLCDCFNMRIGFYGDYVFNRHLEVSDSSFGSPDIGSTQIQTNAGYLVLNCWNRIDLFTTFGASNITMFANSSCFAGTTDTTLVELTWPPYFSWSLGLRGALLNVRCFTLGVEGQYFRTSSTLNNLVRLGSGDIHYFNDNNQTDYEEWQVGLGASYRIVGGSPGTVFAPYAGFKWSGGKMTIDDLTFTFPGTNFTYVLRDLKPSKSWGYALGMTVTVCSAVGINAEARFADEKAVSAIGQLRF